MIVSFVSIDSRSDSYYFSTLTNLSFGSPLVLVHSLSSQKLAFCKAFDYTERQNYDQTTSCLAAWLTKGGTSPQ